MRIWDAPLGLHHCNPAGRRLRTEHLWSAHYHIYLCRRQGFLQHAPYLSIGGGPLLPCQPDVGRKEGVRVCACGCVCVGEHSRREAGKAR